LNALSDAYTKFRLDKHTPERSQLIKLIAQDHTLLRRPIVKSSRLLTVGCDKRKIADMLQIKSDGQLGNMVEVNNVASRKAHRRCSAAHSK
jgi:hypothetical protein